MIETSANEPLGKARADLRTEQIRILIESWEQRRDMLCDEIAFKKGQEDLLEELIKQGYEKILDVNKEEQEKEEAKIQAHFERLREEQEEEKRKLEALELNQKKLEEAKKKRKVKKKQHPNDLAADLNQRKAEARKKKE